MFKTLVTVWIVGFIVAYLLGSFNQATLNIVEWTQSARDNVVFFMVVFLVFSCWGYAEGQVGKK